MAILGVIAFCVMMGEGAMATGARSSAHCGRSGEGLPPPVTRLFRAMAIGRFTGDRLTLRFGPVNLVRGSGLLAAIASRWRSFWDNPSSRWRDSPLSAPICHRGPVVFSASGRSIAGVSTIVISGFSSPP